MSQLKNYYFELFHHDVEPIVNSNSVWGAQGEYATELEHIGYTNWIDDEGVLQSAIPNGEDVVMHINTDGTVALDMDIVAHTVEIGENVTLNLTGNRSLQIMDSFTLNGLLSVTSSRSLTNAADTALQLNGVGTLNLSGDGTSGYLGTEGIRNAFIIGKDLTVTTRGYTGGYIYADLTNAGTITTEAGNLTLNGNTVTNTGSIITGGKTITLQKATVSGTGTLNGVNGEIQLNGATVSNNTLTGYVRSTGDTSTLNTVTVDGNGTLDLQANAIAQGTLTIEGTVSVRNSASLYNASAAVVTLNGVGTLNLSGDGTSGYLGTEEKRNAFTIGENLTVTTLGYTGGSILANLTNNGIITTAAGNLTLNGNTVTNTGTIVTGGKYILLKGANVNGSGSLNGANDVLYLNNSTLTGSILKGRVQTESSKSTLKNVTVDTDGQFTLTADVAAQESLTINGTTSVRNGSHLVNETEGVVVALTGTGTLNLSGDGTSGYLGTEAARNTFSIGKDLTVTTLGYTGGSIFANLTNNGTITTEAGNLTLNGNTVTNNGMIVTGGKYILLKGANVNGSGSLNGANGTLYLNNSTLTGSILKGQVQTESSKSTLKNVTVDSDGQFSLTADVAVQESLTIDGTASVRNGSHLVNETEGAVVALTGTGKLNLSGDGTSGYLGTEAARNTFSIGKDLTVTTLGYSGGSIFANLTNNGTITTEAGNLTLNGSTIANTGTIVTGGDKTIVLENSTVSGSGTLNGANGEIQLSGTAVSNNTLSGYLRTTGKAASTLNQVTVDENGHLDIQAEAIAQGTINIDGKVTVQSGRSLYNASAEAVNLTGTGALNLSGNGTNGYLGNKDNRNEFSIGKDLTVTTLGYSGGSIFANLTNNGTITTAAGNLTLTGNMITNNGTIVTGGKYILLKGANVSGNGALNGEDGTVYLNNSTLTGSILKGQVQAESSKSTLKNVTVDTDGKFTMTTDVAAQESLAIDGTASVQNSGHLVNETEGAVVALTGTGKLNLSGDGTSGCLGTAEKRNAFTIGKDLTVTTLGYSSGYIYADLANEGTITTESGHLSLNGSTIANTGTIVTGGDKTIVLENSTVSGSGTLNGANGEIQLNGTAVSNNTLSGYLRTTGKAASTLNQVTVDENGHLDIQALTIAQGAINIDGKVTVQSGRSLYNVSAEAVNLTGTGTLNLSGNGTNGCLGTEENRNAFNIGKDLTVTTLGYSGGYIYADLANAGTITTEAGNLTLNGSTIANTGTIVTGGNKYILLKGANVSGNGSLNGRKGTVYLNNSTLTGSILKGQVQAESSKSTLKNVTVDVDGKFTMTTDVALQESFTINGTASVQNGGHLVNETADTFVKLSGEGTLNLSGNGTSGSLGSKDAAGGFELGEGLTLTTLGYSSGRICADVKNNGLITTFQGYLNIADCTIENHGGIRTGGKGISVSGTTITGDGVLNGANGTITLANSVLDGAVLNGIVQAQTGNALNGVTVMEEGRLDVIGLSTTNGMQIDGSLTVAGGSRLLSSGEEAAVLTGTGTIGLGGNGTNGYLGDAGSKFIIGEGLKLTTPGYTSGYIYGDVTNLGEITTDGAELNIVGTNDDPLSFRNQGTIRTGGKAISFTRTTVNNTGGSILGENSTVYLNAGGSIVGGTLGGNLQVSGEGAAVTLDEGDCILDGKITVSNNGSLTAKNLLAQGNINVGNGGTLELSNVALAGTVNAAGNPGRVSISGVSGIFELILNAGSAGKYTILGNNFSDAVVKIQGGGNIDLSGNYWGGLTDEAEIREKYGLGSGISIGSVLTESPEGNALFLIGADLANEKYLALVHEGLALSFLSSLAPESITEQTVQLWDDDTDEQISLAGRLPAVQGNRLVFDNGLFEDGHSYRVVLSDGIRSVDGYALNTAFKDTVGFTVDRTAPKVLDIEKTVNLTGKLPDFRITFSSEIDIATLKNALTVTSPDGQNISVQVSLLADGVAMVTSQSAINVPGEYTVSVDAGKLTDKAGNHLVESFDGSIEMTRINLDIMDLTAASDIVVQGESFNVQWKTFNLEDADLYGKWTDGVYLSKDDLWDNSDTLLASVAHYNGLEQGASVTGQAKVTLSGITDGDYYLLVRPDIYNEKPTGASERNVKSVAVSVNTEALPDGERTIRSGQSAIYKFSAKAGNSYQLALDTLRDDYDGMELYVGYGCAPTRENYDAAVRNVNDAQVALVSQNYDQDIYVMLYAKNSGGNIGYTLTAEKVGLNILSVTPGIQAVPDGQAMTFVVEGLCFTPGTTVAAVDAGEQATAGVVTYVNDHQLLLTFEPGQLAEGDYVLKAVDGEATALSDTITLTADGAPNLEVSADLPQMIGNHYITSFDVNYANTGNASMGAVLLTVNIYEVDKDGNKTRSVGIMGLNKSMDQNHKAYNGSYSALPSGYVSTAAIYAQGKVPGQLEPGASGSVTIDLVGLLQPWNTSGNNNLLWEINYFDENTEELLDWKELMPGNSDRFCLAMENAVGSTWGDYVKMLQTNARTLQSVGADASNATDLLQLTVQTVSGTLNPYATVENITDLTVATAGSLDLSFTRFFSNLIDDRGWHTNWEYSLVKEDNDAVTFFSPETGVRTFRKDAYGKYFCENDTGVTLKFKGGQAILQDPACERTWTMDQVDANNWRLTQVKDARGNSIRLSYDKDGNLSKLASSDGEFILISKDGLTGSNGISVSYQYSENGLLTGVSYDDGRNPLAYQYAGDGLTGVYRDDQLVTSYVYDANGSVVQATQGDLVTNVTTEQPGVITVTDSCDHSFTSVYYADGSLAKWTDNVSGSWVSWTYDDNGYCQTMSSSAGLSESFTYDADGNLLRYTDAYGNTSVYTYFQGHLKTAENASGYAVNIGYDQDWNTTEFTCSDGSVTTFDYDENGTMYQIVDPLGNVMSYEYDDALRISGVTCGDYSFAMTYDLMGNIASVTQNGHTTSYEYNTSGQLTSLVDANGNQAKMTYDGNNNLTEAVFADGSSQSWGYDATGDLTSFTTRAGDVIAYTWSADKHLTGTAVAGSQYQYTYDNDGLLTSVTDADSVQNLAFGYDANGFLTGVAYKDGTAVTVERDATGKVASYTIGGQTFAYTWQGGKMSSVSVNGNAFSDYTRNVEGNLTGGNGIVYEYDARNNITKVGGVEYTYNYLPQAISKSTAEGVWTYTYDLDGNLTGEKLGDGSEVSFTYSYDAAGNRLTKSDMVSGVTTAWTYGEMNQILTVQTGFGEVVEYTYDLNGNLLSDGHATYTWTEDSRMATMTADGTTWTYTYDALGNRDSASNGVDTFTFYYDGSGNLLAQYKNGAAYQFYITGATGIEGYIDAEGAVYTFTYDLGGNVTAVSGSNGKSATYTYDAFGNIIGQTGDITDNALTWHGHFGTLLNPDGSYYVLARNYSAADGRFISTDPSWFNDGANLYTYAYNDPVNYLDLDGMKADWSGAPTEHEKGSFLYNISHLEEVFPQFNNWLNRQDLTSNLPTGGPEIGSGHAPEWWFNGMESLIDNNMPDGCDSVGEYYTEAIERAKALYEKGAVSTKDGTVWPSRYSVETVTDKQMSEYYNRYRDAKTQHEKEKYIQRAWRRYRQLKEEEKANNSKPNGGTNATSNNSQSASSHDPNDKLATEGVTELHFVRNGSRLQYTVLFENDPENATAPARKVYVRDVLDDNLDLGTFLLHSFTLAGYTYQLPEGRDSFNDRIILDLGDAKVTVDVAINLDYDTRELIASFTAIDPETGFELQDLTKGVLLVNDDSGRGEGNFNYSIQALPDLPANTQIRNTAEIFFDFNDPIETPTTLNTIDGVNPSVAFDASASGTEITLTLTGTDAESGIAGYDIMYSTDGESFSVYGYTSDATVSLSGDKDAVYYFKVRAVDNVGNTSDWSEVKSVTLSGPDKLFFTGDFNGDGQSMVSVQSDSSTVAVYMNGETWGIGVTLDPGWSIAGVGDFNGDNLDDFLRVNSEGYVVGEMSNGNGTFSPQVLNLKSAGWSILGTGDFDGNGADDVLIANPTAASETVGLLGYWKAGTEWTLINGYSAEWEMVATGDFNGDGKCDMLWRNSFVGEGDLTYNAYCTWIVEDPVDWRMVSVANPAEWNFLCAGDFDGNGMNDIAMINDIGVVGIWGVNDGYLSSWSILSAVDTSAWTLAGVGDFNADGTDDIAWCNTDTGLVGCWQIENKELASWQTIATVM